MFQGNIWICNVKLRIVRSREHLITRSHIMEKAHPTPSTLHPTILLGLTTTPGSNWREKVKEIDELGIKEIALFPTFLKQTERDELYHLLENSKIESIPHVHLREEDMKKDEIDYLTTRFNTKLFNLHANKIASTLIGTLPEYKETIFFENQDLTSLKEIKASVEKAGGLCIDYSHWQNRILRKEEDYDPLMQHLIKNNVIGCCHISVIYKEPKEIDWSNETEPHYSGHYMYELSDLDYMKNYLQYLPDIISLELENSFKEQLKAKKYIEEMINE